MRKEQEAEANPLLTRVTSVCVRHDACPWEGGAGGLLS